MSKFTKFDGYWFKPKGMVQLVWIGGTGVLQPIKYENVLRSVNLNEHIRFCNVKRWKVKFKTKRFGSAAFISSSKKFFYYY